MRKALVVGVNYYEKLSSVKGCVPNAFAVNNVLSQHGDGAKNFDVKVCFANDQRTKISRSQLKKDVQELFSDDSDVALFYFSGHGYIENTGGYIVTSECAEGDEGFSLNELLTIVNDSKARDKIVVLDTCHSGQIGNIDVKKDTTFINMGVTILTSSTKDQLSVDEGDGSTFTKLFVDALDGSAANLLGEISPGSVYAHIDQSLSAWDQRPIFKTNVKNFTSLRKVQPAISVDDLKKIVTLFPDKNKEFNLDPSYEPTSPAPVKERTEIFAILQKYNRVNLVVPLDSEHMYFAAMESKKCKLTVLGEFYWRLVKDHRI